MTKQNSQYEVQFSGNLLERFGGLSQLNMILFDYCERIQDDERFQRFYGNFCFNSLCDVQREIIMLAFMEGDKELARNKVLLHHFRLFELGLNANHFDYMQEHLRFALEHSWMEVDVIEDAMRLFSKLRSLFKNGEEEDEPAPAPQRKTSMLRRLSKEKKTPAKPATSNRGFFARVITDRHPKEGARAA